jgi:CPA2 family monovalent cation:H+ antiporter-2
MHADVTFLSEIGLLLAVAVVLALVGARFRVPAVLAYLVSGVVAGPAGLDLIVHTHDLTALAEFGVVLLLFTIGLEFDLATLRRSWRSILLGGGLQLLGTIAVVAGFVRLFGNPWNQAVVWGMLVALSSTAVVLRLLEDRRETATPKGRLITGVLIAQDLAIVPMVMILPLLSGTGDDLGLGLVWVVVRAILIIAGVVVLSRLVVPRLFKAVARDTPREVFLLAVLATGGIVAWLVSFAGLSFALGAFLAGVVLADTEYRHQAMTDVIPMRSVMMCVFFVGIGMLFDPSTLITTPGPVIGAFLAIGVVKLAVALGGFLLLRYPVPVALVAAASLAQVGEFSLILAGAAQETGLLTAAEEQAFLAAAILSIAITPLVVNRAPRMEQSRAVLMAERLLDPVNAPPVVPDDDSHPAGHVIVAGLGFGGRAVIDALESHDVPTTIIELNPDTVAEERARGRRVVYGDLGSPEVLSHAGLEDALAVVITISDPDAAHRAATDLAREHGVPVLLRTRWASDADELQRHALEVVSEEQAGAMVLAMRVLKRVGIEANPTPA